MASRRNPWAKFGAAAAGAAAGELSRQAQVREAQEEFDRQNALLSKRQQQLAMLNYALQAENQRQAHLRQQATTTETRRFDTMQGLRQEVGEPGSSVGSILARAKEVGAEDPFYAGGGSQITLPGGRTIQHVAHPLRREGEARTPIEELMRTREATEQQAYRDDLRTRQQEAEAQPFVQDGLEGFKMPNGEFRPTERSAAQEGARAAAIYEAGTPGVVSRETSTYRALSPLATSRAANTAAAVAAADPDVREGIGPDGKPGVFRVGPKGAAEAIPGIAPTSSTTSGSGSGNSRIDSAKNQIGDTLTQMMELDRNLTQRSGFGGTVAGATDAVVGGWMKTDPDIVVFRGLSESVLPAFARMSGEVGNLAQQEQERFRFIVPQVGDPYDVRVAKYAAMRRLAELDAQPVTREQVITMLEALKQGIVVAEGDTAPSPTDVIDMDDFLSQ